MRAKKEIDADSYKRKMEILLYDKKKLKELLDDTDNRVDKQIQNVDDTFIFARDAKKEFESNDPERQRQVLLNLGSNLLLKDKIVTFSTEKPFLQIERMVPEVNAIHKQVRTSKNGENERELRALYSQSPTMLRTPTPGRFVLYDGRISQPCSEMGLDCSIAETDR